MTDDDDLNRRLTALAGAEVIAPGGRVIARAGDGAETVLRAVLGAIDETILPADLTVSSEAGESMSLSVAARRLRAVTSASDDLDAEEVLDRELESDDEAGLDAVLSVFDRFARGASGAVVAAEQRGVEDGARGVSARRLLGRLAEPSAKSADPSGAAGADRFLTEGGDRIAAALVRSASGEDVTRGADDLTEALASFAALPPGADLPCFDLWLRQTGRPEGRAFGRAAWADGTVAAIAFAAEDAVSLAAAFRSSCGD